MQVGAELSLMLIYDTADRRTNARSELAADPSMPNHLRQDGMSLELAPA
jgi:hypothetical protein